MCKQLDIPNLLKTMYIVFPHLVFKLKFLKQDRNLDPIWC